MVQVYQTGLCNLQYPFRQQKQHQERKFQKQNELVPAKAVITVGKGRFAAM